MALEGEQLNFLEKTVRLVKRESMWTIMKALLVIAMFVYIMYNAMNIDNVVRKALDKQTIERIEEHDNALEVRREIKPQIDSIMGSVLRKMEADRVFIIEMHNGTNNTAGLPFVYGEMTYEQVSDSTYNIDEDYTNLNLSRFSFPEYLEQHYLWMGHISELDPIDPKMANRMRSNDVSFLAIVRIQGVKNELGYFGLSYCNGREPKNLKQLDKTMIATTQLLSTLLDMSKLSLNN